MVLPRLLAVTLIMAVSAACTNERTDEAQSGDPSASTDNQANPITPDAAYCGAQTHGEGAQFQNAKVCYMAACTAGDAEACEMAESYNGNMRQDDPEARLQQLIGESACDSQTDPETMLDPYRSAGLIGGKPDLESDYSAFYRVAGPATFLDYPLLAFETETMRSAGFIGCCVNRGLSMLVKTDGKDGAAQAFAQKAECRVIADDSYRLDRFKELEIAAMTAPDSAYRVISCHENDRS